MFASSIFVSFSSRSIVTWLYFEHLSCTSNAIRYRYNFALKFETLSILVVFLPSAYYTLNEKWVMLGGGRMVILMHVRGFLHVCAVFSDATEKVNFYFCIPSDPF